MSTRTRPTPAGQRNLLRNALPLLIAFIPGAAQPYALLHSDGSDIAEVHQKAPRWSSRLSSGSELVVEVGIEPGFAEEFGPLTEEEIELLNERVVKAFHAWTTPDLRFEVTLDAAGVYEGTYSGFDIDLFAANSSDPVFRNNTAFGIAFVSWYFAGPRPLTNGQQFEGDEIAGADIYIAADRAVALAELFMMSREERLDGLQRLLMHEIGHSLGLHHNNDDSPSAQVNYDTDMDPLNEMQIDPMSPFVDLIVSPNTDYESIMSDRPCGEIGPLWQPCPALYFTELTHDDLGGQDVLYPLPEPGILAPLGLAMLGLACSPRRNRMSQARVACR